jgi:hypothetical protein
VLQARFHFINGTGAPLFWGPIDLLLKKTPFHFRAVHRGKNGSSQDRDIGNIISRGENWNAAGVACIRKRHPHVAFLYLLQRLLEGNTKCVTSRMSSFPPPSFTRSRRSDVLCNRARRNIQSCMPHIDMDKTTGELIVSCTTALPMSLNLSRLLSIEL